VVFGTELVKATGKAQRNKANDWRETFCLPIEALWSLGESN